MTAAKFHPIKVEVIILIFPIENISDRSYWSGTCEWIE